MAFPPFDYYCYIYLYVSTHIQIQPGESFCCCCVNMSSGLTTLCQITIGYPWQRLTLTLKLLVVCSSLSGIVIPEVPLSALVLLLMVLLLMYPHH